MCGRYNLHSSKEVRVLMSSIGMPDFVPPERFNIAPTESVPVVIEREGQRVVQDARWWLTPSWSGGPSTKYAMFNARSETLATSRAFKAPFKQQRCMIPASSFIEWQTIDGIKQPFDVKLSGSAMAFAGLWDVWHGGDEPLYSCTIVTTDAGDNFKHIHKRAPVMLQGEALDTWLNPETQAAELRPLMQSRSEHIFEIEAIDRAIGNSRNKAAPVKLNVK